MVVWILVGLILGSIVFSIKTIGEYRVIVQDLQPQIESLLSRADRFEEQALEETKRRNSVRERVRELKDLCSGVQRETRLWETKLKQAKKEAEQLEVLAYRLDFESRK
jgi:chromosome segregation ATPase